MNEQRDSIKKSSRLRVIISAVLRVLLVIGCLVFIFNIGQPGSKSDPASERIIRRMVASQLTKDPNNPIDPNNLTDEDFAKLTTLSINSWKALLDIYQGAIPHRIEPMSLSDIKLLRKFTNLQEFQLFMVRYPEQRIPKWMKILGRIGIINLDDRFLIDLKPLENLTHLTKLNFADSDIKNLKPLANLKNLESLNLDRTNVSDLEPLMKLKNLKWLYINYCPNITEKQINKLQKALPELNILR